VGREGVCVSSEVSVGYSSYIEEKRVKVLRSWDCGRGRRSVAHNSQGCWTEGMKCAGNKLVPQM
jgi:hypothetical protein